MINLLIGLLIHRSIEHSVLDQLIDDLSVQLLIKQFASTNSYNICIFYFFIIIECRNCSFLTLLYKTLGLNYVRLKSLHL